MSFSTKPFCASLALFIVASTPLLSFADLNDEIRYRVQKVGKLNIAEAAMPKAPATESTETATSETAVASISGADLYQANCFACHGTGAAGAPVFGKTDQWADRIAKGEETLIKHAINGFNAMPPRGGSALNDAEIKAVVTHMIEGSQ